MNFKCIFELMSVFLLNYTSAIGQNNQQINFQQTIPGIYQIDELVNTIENKNVALVSNHTSMVNKVHLLDTLLNLDINVKKVFAPEHGFRGTSDAGATVKNSKDKKTGISVISLYGKNKKPSSSQLSDVDVVVFDIQDVGVRYYTYLTTMHYVMQSCAENNVEFVLLDRPNPNGFYVDGPVLKPKFSSFVGMHPVPMVHGMTLGELAYMIRGEGWLKTKDSCKLKVITCKNYNHDMLVNLPIRPSPNLPNMNSIYLYPSLGIFEGTHVSVGRGTDYPFQVIGMPNFSAGTFTFTPTSKPGAKYPKHQGKECHGFDLRNLESSIIRNQGVYLNWIVEMYNHSNKQEFFIENNFFDLLAGTDQLKIQIQNGYSPTEIKQSWKEELNAFIKLRSQYLLYPDFTFQKQ